METKVRTQATRNININSAIMNYETGKADKTNETNTGKTDSKGPRGITARSSGAGAETQ